MTPLVRIVQTRMSSSKLRVNRVLKGPADEDLSEVQQVGRQVNSQIGHPALSFGAPADQYGCHLRTDKEAAWPSLQPSRRSSTAAVT